MRPPMPFARLLRVLVVLATTVGTARADAAGPAPAEIRAAALADGGTIVLSLPWRFHAGDDPGWADPAFDDGSWAGVGPLLEPGALPPGGWPGTGWFRRHLRLDEALDGRPLMFRIEAPGSARVFLDGDEILVSGPSGRLPPEHEGPVDGAWATTTLSHRREHLLAVRYQLEPASEVRGGTIGFRLTLGAPDAVALNASQREISIAGTAVFTTIPLLLAVLHLALFMSYRKTRENLFAALFMAALALIVIGGYARGVASPTAFETVLGNLGLAAIIGAVVFGLFTYYSLRTVRMPRMWIAFAAVGAVLATMEVVSPGPVGAWGWYVYFGATLVEIVRVETSVPKARREGTRILLVGLLIMDVMIVLQVLFNLGLIQPIAGIREIYLVGMLAFAGSMSLSLARNFARTRVHLERRLEEVRALSEEVLAREREAHLLELSRQGLEIENARKTAEIEAARALQLSLLPSELPTVVGLEIAASMSTASEVGGDYYDFRVEEGGLVVAVGDATGHGVAAGAVVTAAKALFLAVPAGADLASTLQECAAVLREMDVHPLHMCLSLARIDRRSIALCSAAMPPALVHRAATGAVEELGVGGLPLGARLSARWTERRSELAAGDTVLFLSDGLAEQANEDGELLGYDAVIEALRSTAGHTAEEVVGLLRRRLDAWRGTAEPSDDVTLVVVRVLGD